jgi:hypothetical protein
MDGYIYQVTLMWGTQRVTAGNPVIQCVTSARSGYVTAVAAYDLAAYAGETIKQVGWS